MDVHDIRRDNLAMLVEREGGRRRGGIKAVAEKIETDPNYLSAALSDSPSRRNLGTPLCRRIEDAFSMPRGAMDMPQAADGRVLTDKELRMAREIASLPAHQQAAMEGLLESMRAAERGAS